jgi:hypothetical protein
LYKVRTRLPTELVASILITGDRSRLLSQFLSHATDEGVENLTFKSNTTISGYAYRKGIYYGCDGRLNSNELETSQLEWTQGRGDRVSKPRAGGKQLASVSVFSIGSPATAQQQ